MDLKKEFRISRVGSQGRYGQGQGKEFAEHYLLEYWRQALGKWVTYSNHTGHQVRMYVSSYADKSYTRHVVSMIHSARPTVSPVANIVFTLFVVLDIEKWGRTDSYERKQGSIPAVTVGWPSGSITIS